MKRKKIKVLIAIGAIAGTIAMTPVTNASADNVNSGATDGAGVKVDNNDYKQEKLAQTTKDQMFKTENTIDLAKTKTTKSNVKNAIDEFVKVKVSKEIVELEKFKKINEYQFNSITDLIAKLPEGEQKEVIGYFKNEMSKYFKLKESAKDNLEVKVKNLVVKENTVKAKEEAKPEVKEEAKAKEKEVAKPEVKEEAKAKEKEVAKPEVKEEAKAKEKEAAKPEVKEGAKTKEKEVAKPEVKEEAKTKEKEVAKPEVKEEVKAKEKEEAKPEVKEEAKAKEEAKPEVKPEEKPVKLEKKFHSEIQEKLYHFLLNSNNRKSVFKEAVRLHNGDASNTCVYFASEALRRIGVDIPKHIAYTTKLEEQLIKRSFVKDTDFSALEAGDICFAGEAHTYVFMGWADKVKGIAEVADNQVYRFGNHYHERGLYDGKGVTPTSHYYKFVKGAFEKEEAEKVVAKGIIDVNSYLNVRSSASTNSRVLGTLKGGESVNIQGKDGAWYKIEFKGDDGYVYGRYVKDITAVEHKEDKPIAKPVVKEEVVKKPEVKEEIKPEVKEETKHIKIEHKKGKVVGISSYLNVRSSNSTSSGVIGSLRNGNEVTVKGKSGSWYEIDFNGRTGYVYSRYLDVITWTEDKVITVNSKTETKETEKKNETIQKSSLVGTIRVGSYLNVRSGSSTSDSIIGRLSNGAKVNVIKKHGSWYEINYNGRKGYIYKDYVSVRTITESVNTKVEDNSNDRIETAVKVGRVHNVTSNLRVRDGSSTRYMVKGYLKPNQTVKVLESNNGWYKIEYNGTTGWVSGDYIKII